MIGACSAGPIAGNSVVGTVQGKAFSIRDAVSAAVTGVGSGGVMMSGAKILMSTTSDLCGELTANSATPNEQIVVIFLSDFDGTVQTTPTAVGTYTVYPMSGTMPAKGAVWGAVSTDAMCKVDDADSARG
jgi:hypothetical protein